MAASTTKNSPLVTLHQVTKSYKIGDHAIDVLDDVSLTIHQGEMVAIMGPSGSGKSTLMNIIGLLDRPTKGELELAGKKINLSMSDASLASIRSNEVGFVFQSFNLLPRLTALENVLMPTAYNAAKRAQSIERAYKNMEALGIHERVKHKPSELSGGEKQRVAIARALINDPKLILADEPTGNLDSKSGKDVVKILHDLHQTGKTVVIVTHDNSIAKACERIIRIHDGRIAL
jgi:putative ABC transport system ATP-binding protein